MTEEFADRPSLVVDPSRAKFGEHVTLRPEGPGAGHLLGGVVSFIQAETEEGWRNLYWLFSPAGALPGPSYKQCGGEGVTFVPMIGVLGAVKVVIPPVTPGTYRISREFHRPTVTLSAAIEVTT